MAISSTQGTLITLYRGVPLDMTYNQTVYLSSNSAQSSFFSNYHAITFNNQSYQRVNRNTLRIATDEANITNCNYLSFNNLLTGGTSKTIYAFITNIRYVSNTVTEVDYEIDPLQTWMVEMISNLEPCYVERQHAVVDAYYGNLVPEPITAFDYYDQWQAAPATTDPDKIVIAATFNTNFEDAVGGYFNGVYSGLCYNSFSSASAANEFILGAVDKNLTDGIVAVFMAPGFLELASPGTPNNVASVSVTITPPTSCDGYTPKNKKVLTYPYTYLIYDNLNGGISEFKYELFGTPSSVNFTFYGSLSCTPEILLIPNNYAGADPNYHYSVYINSFPQCAYATDTFKAWLAQNKYQLGASMQNTALDTSLGILGLASGNPLGAAFGIGAIINGFKNANQIGAQIRDMSTKANTAHGGNNGIINTALGASAGGFVKRTPTYEAAQLIDNFFTRYGYAQNRIMKPNLHARPHWTYIKTAGFAAKGNIPAYAAAKINTIMDNGITFWNSSSDIGNYSLDNSA